MARQKLFLRGWRDKAGISQEELAARTGLTQGMISKLENDESDYSGDTLWKLAVALDCRVYDLLMRDPDDPQWHLIDALEAASLEERERIGRVTYALIESRPLDL